MNAGSPADFQEYTPEANARMIADVWEQVDFLRSLPQELRQAFAAYAEGVTCQGEPEKGVIKR